ncbi:trans-sulfuration enzyme family protein [Sphingomonas sp. CCH21-G11]|jgi:cystathionine beta-lyase|uniref:trans-sulfuration enzyme family protein n=1 Tax=Sphingomonas sp. CCH21-G11 TaxID=1768749 RepID=UPI000837730C|nr:PLP-dependent transferase [Sphingomonas sp. CCH21-G11]
MHDETLCLPIRKTPEDGFESLVVPLHRASTITFQTVESYQNRRDAIYDGYSYGLYGTPTTRALEMRIAELERASRALVVPSGFAAIVLTTLASAQSGQCVLFPDSCYDTIRPFAANFLQGLGIKSVFYDPEVGSEISQLLDDDVALVWVESPGSITLEVQDVPAIAAAAHARGIKVAADNAWATPLRYRPLEHGCDFSIIPLSKYLNGHSDVVMGAIAVRDVALYRRLKDFSRYLGMGASSDDASLVLRGIETLAVRLDRSEASAHILAQLLQARPSVLEVRHPALVASPGHDFWKRDFSGSSGVFSVFLDPAVRPVLAGAVEALEFFAIGASWGGTRSVVAILNQAPLRSVRPLPHTGPIIRLSIGLEHVEDLRADLEKAFDRLDAAVPAHATQTQGADT